MRLIFLEARSNINSEIYLKDLKFRLKNGTINEIRIHPLKVLKEINVPSRSNTIFFHFFLTSFAHGYLTIVRLYNKNVGKIAGFKHPARVFTIVEWPMTSSGKILKRMLKSAALDGQLKELLWKWVWQAIHIHASSPLGHTKQQLQLATRVWKWCRHQRWSLYWRRPVPML